MNSWTNSTFLPKQNLIMCSDSPIQSITQNLKIRKPLHARDWWLLHHWTKDTCFHEETSQLIGVTPKISSDCPTINFSYISNICFIVRLFPVFLMERKFSEWFYPMNTDASNVEDINIPHITECFLLSCIASFGDWSNIFRTRSSTLCENDLDFNVRSVSVAVLESISSSSMTNLSVYWVNKPAGC